MHRPDWTTALPLAYPAMTETGKGGILMTRRMILAIALALSLGQMAVSESQAQQPIGRSWNSSGQRNWERFYHYPYVYYPQNFMGSEYYQSSDSLYFRYPQEMRIPVYNRKWHNYYPSSRLYHRGHHFQVDVF